MASPKPQDPSLALVRERLQAGDMQGLRSALMHLSPEGREELELRLGKPALQRMMRNARRVTRGYRGKVVVIHGIMGGKLATRQAGDEDLVWVNYLRLFAGRIADFRLDANGSSADPTIEVVSCGLLDEYLPLVMELDGTWEVKPFAFDWRLDMARSADLLNDAIVAFAAGKPVHIVAHSMGGVVARQFIRTHAATWAAMADPQALRSGGRLVMLGTPNRGSFAIPFVLTGEEKLVKTLEFFDWRHDMDQLLDIIDTFPGSYQMLPSPRYSFGDDRAKLYARNAWGTYPVTQPLLDAGRVFQENLDPVIDPQRLVYVAGYDQDTPYRIKVEGPGRFKYQQTREGDGRVPHELGRLPGVETFYVREVHGDLPSNERVLAGVHELLMTGRTSALEPVMPPVRGVPSREWVDASVISPMAPEVAALVGSRKRRRDSPVPSREVQAMLESILVESFVGTRGEGVEFKPSPEPGSGTKPVARRTPVQIEVMWGDIREADGEIYVAGHYQGVSPQYGELALDKMVSGLAPHEPAENARLVITSLTRRGMIRAAVGDIQFFPVAGAARKTVAIAGMGHPGTFGRNELQRLARNLVQAVAVLPNVRTVNTLLIGSGTGNLSVPTAVASMLAGLAEALGQGATGALRKIRIVERDWRTAQAIYREINGVRGEFRKMVSDPIFSAGTGGAYSTEILLSVVAAAASQRAHAGRAGRGELARLLRQVPAQLRGRVQEAVGRIGKGADVLQVADGLNLRYVEPRDLRPDAKSLPTRISFVSEAGGARAAAIADTAVVPERYVAFNWALVDELVEKMTDPEDPASIRDNSALMADFVVPRDFRAGIEGSAALIYEVDRRMARIHWEMLGDLSGEGDMGAPLALARPVSRQLRTAYSPPPSRAAAPSDRLRALVVGDPGDPDAGLSLPGARREAIEVAKILQGYGVEVTALIGAATARRTGELAVYAPASMLDMLVQLRKGFDILHFAGHGDFKPDDPEGGAGWIFGTELFTSRELGSIDKVPRMTVANACLSGLLSDRTLGKAGDALLLPGLADEFFRRGVRNYIGTAWPVSDEGAILFARVFYEVLLDPTKGGCMGDAVLAARRALQAEEPVYGALWAAYQHYGDPTFMVRAAEAPRRPRRAAGRRRKARK